MIALEVLLAPHGHHLNIYRVKPFITILSVLMLRFSTCLYKDYSPSKIPAKLYSTVMKKICRDLLSVMQICGCKNSLLMDIKHVIRRLMARKLIKLILIKRGGTHWQNWKPMKITNASFLLLNLKFGPSKFDDHLTYSFA